jgi:hypothetical protein
MKLTNYRWLSALAAFSLLLSSCGSAAPDAAAIATAAVQTVEARYTALAIQQPTLAPTQPPAATATLEAPPAEPVLQPTQPVSTPQVPANSTVPCLAASYVADISIADYAIVTPGAQFTKTWRVKNAGSCPWDAGYKLVYDSGNAMSTVTSIALPQVVYQDQTVDISITLTAPTTEGVYKGYWKLATSFGGTIGFGQYNSPLSVIITSSSNTKKSFSVVSVTYDPLVRSPKTGCPAAGTQYTLTAHVSVNSAGNVNLHFARNPYDGSKYDVYKLNFKDAGTKTVSWTWTFYPDAVKNIDRWIAVSIDSPEPYLYDRAYFTWSCQ